MWHVGSALFLGSGFGRLYAYAPVKIEYAIDRYAMEDKRSNLEYAAAFRKWPLPAAA